MYGALVRNRYRGIFHRKIHLRDSKGMGHICSAPTAKKCEICKIDNMVKNVQKLD